VVCIGRAARRELLGIQSQPDNGNLIFQQGIRE
jgi:hypothetical protein